MVQYSSYSGCYVPSSIPPTESRYVTYTTNSMFRSWGSTYSLYSHTAFPPQLLSLCYCEGIEEKTSFIWPPQILGAVRRNLDAQEDTKLALPYYVPAVMSSCLPSSEYGSSPTYYDDG